MKITKKMMIKFRAFSLRNVAPVTTYYVMAIWVIRLAFLNGKQLNLSSVCSAPCFCQNHLLRMVTATAFSSSSTI